MRIVVYTVALAVAALLAGCTPDAAPTAVVTDPNATLFTVDFQQGRPLRYRFVTSRSIEINWDPTKAMSGSRGSLSKATESLDIVVVFEPIEVDPYGLSKIKATFESVKVSRTQPSRSSSGGRDAAETLRGKSYTFEVDPAGRVAEHSQLNEVIREVGENAFRAASGPGKPRVKEPDMISDVIATQRFLWDPVSRIPRPSRGVVLKEKWRSILLIPTPMVSRKAMDVTYTLAEIQNSPKGRVAVIDSTCKLANFVPSGWPVPYVGRFQMSGMFGFLRSYKFLSLDGSGRELFNIDTGRTQQYTRKYQLETEAMMLIPLGPNPRVTIGQTITVNLLGP